MGAHLPGTLAVHPKVPRITAYDSEWTDRLQVNRVFNTVACLSFMVTTTS